MLRSSCLCGAVSWDVNGEVQFMSHCHCSRCRKTRGAPFATDVAAQAADYAMRGREHVASFRSSANLTRDFCARCGSTVPGQPWEGLIFVPAGNFEEDPGVRPIAHIFVASKAPWYEIPDQLPRFDAYPPGIEASVLPDLPRPQLAGQPRGSCLCGAISFELTSPPVLSHNCHCRRCRKKCSAAYSSSLMIAIDDVRFIGGENLLVTYKLPEAKFFAQVFCRLCGSKMPRLDTDRGVAIVPIGALDNDPGIRPQAHIYVGSKAPWFDIHDALPQFVEHYRHT